MSEPKSKLREYIEAILLAVLIAFFIRTFVIQAYKIPSGSMIPTLLIGDHIRLASIDRSIVTVGDLVNDEKILEIRPDRVTLGKEGKKRTIFLEQSPMKLTVEDR